MKMPGLCDTKRQEERNSLVNSKKETKVVIEKILVIEEVSLSMEKRFYVDG